MNELRVERNKNFDEQILWGKPVVETDCENLITEDTLVYIDGQPQILYVNLRLSLEERTRLVWACKNIRYEKSVRSGRYAVKTESATFGYMPRRSLFQDFCYKALKAKDDPRTELIFADYALKLEEIYRKNFPDVYEAHKQLSDQKILSEWKLDGSIFSSGISNQNNQLPYHRDNGNFKGVYSNMIGFKKDIVVGHLICPEIDLKFEISDGSLLIFNGQDILHGVSPIIKASPEAYRYTVVYYTLQQMWNCLPIGEEVKRIRKVKETRELKRLEIIRAQEAGEPLPLTKEQKALLKLKETGQARKRKPGQGNNRVKTE